MMKLMIVCMMMAQVLLSATVLSISEEDQDHKIAQNIFWNGCDGVPKNAQDFQQICQKIVAQDKLLSIAEVLDLYEKSIKDLLDDKYPLSGYKEKYFYQGWREKVWHDIYQTPMKKIMAEVFATYIFSKDTQEDTMFDADLKHLYLLHYICCMSDEIHKAYNKKSMLDCQTDDWGKSRFLRQTGAHFVRSRNISDLGFIVGDTHLFGMLQWLVQVREGILLQPSLNNFSQDTNDLRAHGQSGFFYVTGHHDLFHSNNICYLHHTLNLLKKQQYMHYIAEQNIVKDRDLLNQIGDFLWLEISHQNPVQDLVDKALSFVEQYAGNTQECMTALIVVFFCIHEPSWKFCQSFTHLLKFMQSSCHYELSGQLKDLGLEEYGIDSKKWFETQVPDMLEKWMTYLKKDLHGGVFFSKGHKEFDGFLRSMQDQGPQKLSSYYEQYLRDLPTTLVFNERKEELFRISSKRRISPQMVVVDDQLPAVFEQCVAALKSSVYGQV